MDLDAVDDDLLAVNRDGGWELFHENSKASRYERHHVSVLWPTDDQVVEAMRNLRQVKAYIDNPKVELPVELPASGIGFDEVVLTRETARAFGGDAITLAELSKVLFFSYGVSRDNSGTHFPRPFRTVPSGGALYPLELYVHARAVEELPNGLYHYDGEAHRLDRLALPDRGFVESFIQPELVTTSAATIVVSALFDRSTFKYGDRGYRFALLEAGHVAQNAVLTATGLGLASAPIGGFLDRDLDRLLRLDGVEESVVYALHLGRPPHERPVLTSLPTHED
jgi:SagB-type dehydrogenase family enzyme